MTFNPHHHLIRIQVPRQILNQTEFIVRIQDKQFIEMALMLVAKQVLEDVYHGTWPAVKAKWETLQNKSTVWLG